MAETRRQRIEALRSQLEFERAPFLEQWKELGEYILPNCVRVNVNETKGRRKNKKIIDSAASTAARTLTNGMLNTISPPAKPWQGATTRDQDLDKWGPVKEWLEAVAKWILRTYESSNFYNVTPLGYRDIGTFATGCILVEEDIEQVIRLRRIPLGEFMIFCDEKGRVRGFFRHFRMTVRQLVGKFGRLGPNGQPDWSNFSLNVKKAWDDNNLEQWVEVCHIIEPNRHHDPDKLEAKFKKFSSTYYEHGMGGQPDDFSKDRFLRESGYDFFPILGMRWEPDSETAYGTDCPGMLTIGDVKQLQHGEKKGAQGLSKMVDPSMVAPPEVKQSGGVNLLPGGVTYASEADGRKGVRAAHEIALRLDHLEAKQAQVRGRISRGYYEDIFLMMTRDERDQRATAAEVLEKKDEKFTELVQVYGNLNQDYFDPMFDIAFAIGMARGELPPPPEELVGRNVLPKYSSVMAEAQKLVGLGGLERFAGFVGRMAEATQDPEILDNVNKDRIIQVYGDRCSVDAGIVNDPDKVAEIRAERRQAIQAQQQAEQAAAMAKTAKDLSATDTSRRNGLTDLMSAMGQQAQVAA